MPTLADEPLYAYLCVHGASSAWFRLKWIADLNALLAGRTAEEIAALPEEVRDEIHKVIGFWLELGLSGFRVDAVPFLIEQAGTKNPAVTDPHDYLRELRHIGALGDAERRRARFPAAFPGGRA